MQFDNWFSDLDEERLNELKEKSVTVSILAKHPKRIKTIAEDIWTHYKAHVEPDGYKARLSQLTGKPSSSTREPWMKP